MRILFARPARAKKKRIPPLFIFHFPGFFDTFLRILREKPTRLFCWRSIFETSFAPKCSSISAPRLMCFIIISRTNRCHAPFLQHRPFIFHRFPELCVYFAWQLQNFKLNASLPLSLPEIFHCLRMGVLVYLYKRICICHRRHLCECLANWQQQHRSSNITAATSTARQQHSNYSHCMCVCCTFICSCVSFGYVSKLINFQLL